MFGFKLLAKLFKADTEAQVAPEVLIGTTHKETVKKKPDQLFSYRDIHHHFTKETYRLPFDLKDGYPMWTLVEQKYYRRNKLTPNMTYSVSTDTCVFFSVNLNKYFIVKPLFRWSSDAQWWTCVHEAIVSGVSIVGFGVTMKEAFDEFIAEMVKISGGNFVYVNPLVEYAENKRKHHEQM